MSLTVEQPANATPIAAKARPKRGLIAKLMIVFMVNPCSVTYL